MSGLILPARANESVAEAVPNVPASLLVATAATGERERRDRQQSAAAGDRVDKTGGEADNCENGEDERRHAGSLRL